MNEEIHLLKKRDLILPSEVHLNYLKDNIPWADNEFHSHLTKERNSITSMFDSSYLNGNSSVFQ